MSKKKKMKLFSGIAFEPAKRKIIEILTQNPNSSFNYKQIAKRLNVSNFSDRHFLSNVLQELAKKGLIIEVGQGKYKVKDNHGSVTGIVDLTKMGYGFVVTDDIEDDVFISARNLHSALHGDKVKVSLFARKKGNRPEGEVIEIISRARTTFVGTMEILPNYAFLIPDNKNMPFDIFIAINDLGGAGQGQKAVAEIIDWDTRNTNPKGKIISVLGDPGLHETEMHAILAEYELPCSFTPEVENEAACLPAEITAEDLKNRRDFRDVPTFTIDPADAKDFDDALSIKKLDNGNWQVGIHIADVTYYIKPDTILDNEASRRATSIYLVDRVIPMLPEQLSNNLCSLNEGADKLTFSAVFDLDDKANVTAEWFGRTIINSDKRFSYTEAQEVIDTNQGPLHEELAILNNLAQTIRKKRFAAGAISFDKTEVKFELDANGKPLAITFCENGTANELIEEFMLLANKKVAEFVGKTLKESPFVYRIHDKPDPEKMNKLSTFVTRFGYKLTDGEKNPLPKTINKLLKSVKGKKEQTIIEDLTMRSLSKAIYSTKNIGHYGLAFKYYTHFTSPIRRFPDMMVHRLLSAYLEHKTPEKLSYYDKQCEHSSNMERLSMEAERASIKYKQVEFMSDKTGKVFDGIISGVTEWGIYVELTENLCEGMIRINDLGEDFFEYDEDDYCVKGRSTGKIFTLGDKIKIEVVKADLDKKQLDFKLAEQQQQ